MTVGPDRPDPRAVVAGGIQNLLATRLGRGFIPLAGLFVAGVVRVMASAPGGWLVALGALASGGALLAFGLAVVQDVLARPRRTWRYVARAGAVVPAIFGAYVLGWRGLRGLAGSGGALDFGTAILYVVLGVWVLRAWLRVVEIRRLARVMTENIESPPPHSDGESA